MLPSVESMEMVFKVLLVLLTVVVVCAALTFGIHYIQVIMPLILHIILTGLAAVGHFLAGSVVGLLGNLSHVILQKLAQQVVMFTASRESIKCTTVCRCVYSSLCLPLVVFIHVSISRYVHAYSSLCLSLAVFTSRVQNKADRVRLQMNEVIVQLLEQIKLCVCALRRKTYISP